MKTLLSLAALSAAVELTAAADDSRAIQGEYTIVSGEENGKALPADHFKGSLVRITKDEIIGVDKNQKQIFVTRYVIDASKTPHVLKMHGTSPEKADANGLIKKDGDTVTLIYALPGGKMPTEFKTGDRQNMFVLKPVGKGGKPRGK
jgi:uncharacterized protein (TIGR03067 family)